MFIQGSTVAAAIAASAAVAHGSPTGSNRNSVPEALDKRARWSYEEWCYLKDDDREHIWAAESDGGLDVGPWFDYWLKTHLEDDWVERMNDDWKGEPTDMICGDDYGVTDCTTSQSCETYYYGGQAETWWIFRALNRFYQTLGAFSHVVTDETLWEVTNIEAIIDKFGEEMDEDNGPWSVVSAALGIGGAIVGENPAAAAGLGILSGITSLVGELAAGDDEPLNNRAVIEGAINQLFEYQKKSISIIRELVIHGEYMDMDAVYKNTSHIPMQTGDWDHPIARFFDGGKWLLDTTYTEDMIKTWKSQYTRYARQGIVGSLLKAQDYFVYIMLDVKDEDQCRNEYEDSVRQWIDGYGCADFFKFTSDKYTEGQSALTVDDDMVHSMSDEKFGSLNFRKMYENAIKCAESNPNGDGAIQDGNLGTVDDLPDCFFNYAVIRGRDKKLGRNIRDITAEEQNKIDTSGREKSSW